MMITSKDIVTQYLGAYDVHAYEEVKRFYMKLGAILPKALLERVGGREAYHGERCDGVTNLGKWEFCVSHNGKNSAGGKADMLRCPGRCVQILGIPKHGWMSGEQFLEQHGIPAVELDGIVESAVSRLVMDSRQLRLPL